ncbi:hypothetical protein MVEN_01362800 [Mycena venus]|uniref:PROP1-like PPR domain-containing protein n=1 Tax=Mycena venus TaxID=2733690 RepID=A0A8H6XVS6_9AGAR|nr:hypothetical protein MVEN_01362800 [Mycena venus]
MLPKVATHLLHSTTRGAAAAVHSQSHTLRNVLHSSTSAPTSGNAGRAGSGGSSNGPGPGGQKYTGSRYTGYNSAGRAVTQAHAITSQDGSVAQTDDAEELPAPRRVSLHTPTRTRPRSHIRSPRSPMINRRPPPVLVRRNSTSSNSTSHSVTSSTPPTSIDAEPAPRSRPSTPTDPASPQTVTPPFQWQESPAWQAIYNAHLTGDPALVAQAVRDLVDHVPNPSVREYNCALEALRDTRRPGEPLILLMQTYNAMLKKQLLPNLRTYFELITAITDRDHEIFTTITALEARARRGTANPTDAQRIQHLRAENTFDSAMKLFETVNTSDGASRIPLYLYVALLRSCANHMRQDAALHILTALEHRKDLKPVASVYKHMIRAYASPTGIADAEMIFSEFISRSAEGDIDWTVAYDDPHGPRRQHIQVFNEMITAYFRAGLPDKAVALLERMIASPARAAFAPSDIPRPASSTYTVTIAGFIHGGDVETALAWFTRLLGVEEIARQPYESAAVGVVRPDGVCWAQMLDGLAGDGLRVRDTDREMVYLANVRRLPELKDDDKATETGSFIVRHVLTEQMDIPRLVRPIWKEYVRRGMHRAAVAMVAMLGTKARAGVEPPVGSLMRAVLGAKTKKTGRGGVQWDVARELVRLAGACGVPVPPELGVRVLHSYASYKVAPNQDAATGRVPLSVSQYAKPLVAEDYAALLGLAVELEIGFGGQEKPEGYMFEGLMSLLEDMQQSGVGLVEMPPKLVRRVVKTLFVTQGTDGMRASFARLGPKFARVLEDEEHAVGALADAASVAEVETQMQAGQAMSMDVEPQQQGQEGAAETHTQTLGIDKSLTRAIEEVLTRPAPAFAHPSGAGAPGNIDEAMALFTAGVGRGKAPTAFVLGRLIQSLGRASQLDRVRDVYTAAQILLRGLEGDKHAQSSAWFAIENSMIVALAHAGDLEGAHVHRVRILEMGGAPSADAYGALILYVRDTTDDTSNAMALFQEAQVHRVQPNQYLYNNIISKLAKARKADYALELFEQMKASGWAKPSSITYGAVIGACARVGDVQSAENLFAEMMAQPNYKPRVPPFNTMMQLYTTTRPNRERALYFYTLLRDARIAPTAYTYKLLMDTYGRIEPVDIETMEQIWEALRADPSVELQGNHFATLINAYGCVQRDLDKAIAVFNSIPGFPRAPPRDALVFEAMVNALVAHRRTDLMPEYVALMHSEGVHMTAYIANFLIKGYADVGDMEQARSIFEGLMDPPSGVAAVHNHAPHEPGMSPVVDPMEPVYREPSTWEVMVRAELGSGNRENANALLERLQARCYPEAVYNRISGILVDHSMVLPS